MVSKHDIRLEKSQFYLFNGRAIVGGKITPPIQRIHPNSRGHRPIFSLYRIPRECSTPRNSFHLVHVTEWASWDEQFPGLGKHQGNALSRYCETRNYLSQFLLWTTSNMNGDCELYLCFHFDFHRAAMKIVCQTREKREFNFEIFARMIYQWFPEYLEKIKNLFH